MPSKNCQLPLQFGLFSKLPPHRLQQIRDAAIVAATAYVQGDESVWTQMFRNANKTLSKHERGLFSAFAMAEAGL